MPPVKVEKKSVKIAAPPAEKAAAVNLFDLTNLLVPEARAMLFKDRLDVGEVIRVDPNRPDETAVRFTCDLLTAMTCVDVARAACRKTGDPPIRAYLFRSKAWTRLPLEQPLTVMIDGECVLNPKLFSSELPIVEAIPPKQQTVALKGRRSTK